MHASNLRAAASADESMLDGLGHPESQAEVPFCLWLSCSWHQEYLLFADHADEPVRSSNRLALCKVKAGSLAWRDKWQPIWHCCLAHELAKTGLAQDRSLRPLWPQ